MATMTARPIPRSSSPTPPGRRPVGVGRELRDQPDLPMPGAPSTTTVVWPARAWSSADESTSSSARRPTRAGADAGRGVRRGVRAAGRTRDAGRAQVERGIVIEDRHLQSVQLGAEVDPELLRERDRALEIERSASAWRPLRYSASASCARSTSRNGWAITASASSPATSS